MALTITDAVFNSGGTGSADGIHNNRFSGASSGTVPYLTSTTDEVVVLIFNSEPNHTSGSVDIVSVIDSDPSIIWQKRSALHYVGISTAHTDNTTEVWWAHVPTAKTGSVTVTLGASIDDAAGSTFSVSGFVDPTNPWGVAAPTTAFLADVPQQTPTASIDTTGSDTIVLGFYGSPVNNNPGAGAGFTQVDSLINNGGTNWSSIFVQAKSFASPQTALAVPLNGSIANWGYLVDALDAAGFAGGGGGPSGSGKQPIIVIMQ